YSGSSAFSFARNAGTNSRASLSPRGLFAYAANETSGRVSSVTGSAKELRSSETSDSTTSKQPRASATELQSNSTSHECSSAICQTSSGCTPTQLSSRN